MKTTGAVHHRMLPPECSMKALCWNKVWWCQTKHPMLVPDGAKECASLSGKKQKDMDCRKAWGLACRKKESKRTLFYCDMTEPEVWMLHHVLTQQYMWPAGLRSEYKQQRDLALEGTITICHQNIANCVLVDCVVKWKCQICYWNSSSLLWKKRKKEIQVSGQDL